MRAWNATFTLMKGRTFGNSFVPAEQVQNADTFFDSKIPYIVEVSNRDEILHGHTE